MSDGPKYPPLLPVYAAHAGPGRYSTRSPAQPTATAPFLWVKEGAAMQASERVCDGLNMFYGADAVPGVSKFYLMPAEDARRLVEAKRDLLKADSRSADGARALGQLALVVDDIIDRLGLELDK